MSDEDARNTSWEDWWYKVQRINYDITRNQIWRGGHKPPFYIVQAYHCIFLSGLTPTDAIEINKRLNDPKQSTHSTSLHGTSKAVRCTKTISERIEEIKGNRSGVRPRAKRAGHG